MPRSQFNNRTQLALGLERESQSPPVIIVSPEGLLRALADLLLAALGAAATTKGDGDERQDHA